MTIILFLLLVACILLLVACFMLRAEVRQNREDLIRMNIYVTDLANQTLVIVQRINDLEDAEE